MASTAAAANGNNNAKRGGIAGGFLQALIRGVKPSSKHHQQQQHQGVDVADLENASVLTRAQKRRLSSDPAAAAAAATAAAAANAAADQAAGNRKALNVLNNANQQPPQQQQQLRRASKRRSTVTAAATKGKRSKKSSVAATEDGVADGLKLSQESNFGIRGMFASQGAAENQDQRQPEAQPPEAEAQSEKAARSINVKLCMELASQDSVLTSLARTCRYLDHYPYALESFFLDQDLEEAYRRDLPIVDFLQPQYQGPTAIIGGSGLRWDMIRVLFDWLVNAHESLELNNETLYLTVKLVYMYLSRRHTLPRQSLQLLAVAALWIASKKEELYAVQLDKLICLTLGEYTPRQIMSMEQQILSTVDFRINWPLSYNFLRRYLRVVDHENQLMSFLARYLLELSLLDHQLNLERESAKAAAALWLARAQLGIRPVWPNHLSYSAAWSEAELLPLARRLNAMSAAQLEIAESIVLAPGRAPQSTTFFKYSHIILRKVALTPALPADSELLRG